MTPMIPGFTPMQFSAPPKMEAQGAMSPMAQQMLKAALQPGARPAAQPGAAQPGVAPGGAQMGLLAKLFGGMQPAAPDGMLPDVTGQAGSIFGLR